MRKLLTTIFASALVLAACSSTSVSDLKLIMILLCGSDDDACSIEEDNACEGHGRWDDFRDHNEIAVYDNSDKLMERHDLAMGTFDPSNNTCTFSETINVKSTARYRIFIDKRGPFDITKSTLENQNWTAVLEFNN